MSNLSTRQSFLAARELRARADILRSENVKIRKAFGDRLTQALTQECLTRDEQIDAYEAAAVALDFDETAAAAA